MKSYNHSAIEKKWQKKWGKNSYKTPDVKKGAENFYLLTEFPYPSGNLHVGHWYAFAVPDILARYLRMNGKNVLYPIGFDAFGLPAENAALQRGLNPRIWTYGNIASMRKQFASMGASFDWSREVVTADPAYYQWTQWLFLKLYERGLVYRKKTNVNWCPKDKTVLANEQVKDEKCERCGTEVEQRKMEQWNIKITDYAERLLTDLDALDCPEEIKTAQRNWIGKSTGAEIKFEIKGASFNKTQGTADVLSEIVVFTTRPDTLFGVSFIALAPSHPLAKEARNLCAINPANNEEVPVFVADYVVDDYGTGAVMGVPAHDERDREFALKNNIPIKNTDFASTEVVEKFSTKKTQYKLHDWVVSRQRYWGVPIPLIKCERCGWNAVPEKDLPVKLPDIKDYVPTGDGKSPLAKVRKWVEVKCPKCGGSAERETDTLDTFVDSSWYFLRYTDPKNKKEFAARKKMSAWLPVDFYSGGAEHTTMHLLYSRFWHKALFDIGLVADKEPYAHRINRGFILGTDGQKMSKSHGNVIDPDEEVKQVGADTVRMYLAFIGPYNETGSYPWDKGGIAGIRRFLERVWRLQEKIGKCEAGSALLHQTIKKVSEDITALKFNTAISALMVLSKAFENEETIAREDFGIFLRMLAPFAPHLAEELWHENKYNGSVHKAPWPAYIEATTQTESVTIVVQINGKMRGAFSAARGVSEADAFARAAGLPEVARWLSQKQIQKRFFVKDKLVSFVAS
ncbi:MAG: class I tRNA ligase family protein [bacterium]|nr:class I tRNA ligase family protein [bacterium]